MDISVVVRVITITCSGDATECTPYGGDTMWIYDGIIEP